MIFNLFLPLISFMVYLGTYLHSNVFLSVAIILTSISMTLYVMAMSYEVYFKKEDLKKAYLELPLKSLISTPIKKAFGYLVIYLPVFGILYVSYLKSEFNYTIWWTFIFFMLVFFMYHLKKIKKEIVNKKRKENYEEK